MLAQCPVTAHAALAARRQLRLDCRIVLVCHFNHSEPEEYRKSGDLPGDRAYQRMLKYETAVLEQVDQVIYVSDWARQTVERERNIHPRSSAVIHNGIPQRIECSPLTRQALGLNADDLVLVNVGTLEPRKNQIGLLDLFEKIAQRHENARLMLVGAGHQRSQIEHAIAQKNLNQRVRLLGARSDVPSILAISDLYLHYAKLENCPVVLLECARAGLPFAAIAAGGIPELQQALGVELSLNPNNLDGTMAVLDPVLTDPAIRSRPGPKRSYRLCRAFHHRRDGPRLPRRARPACGAARMTTIVGSFSPTAERTLGDKYLRVLGASCWATRSSARASPIWAFPLFSSVRSSCSSASSSPWPRPTGLACSRSGRSTP